jgi:glycosyltransferase involved in cell wall biosynthesis/predicted Zn-dependent protease
MSRRYLFGPVSAAFAELNLAQPRRAGQCLAFDHEGATGLAIRPGDRWEDVCARLPAGWRPELLVLCLHFTTPPAALWSAPVPVIGLAGDWHLVWHYYRHCLPLCDLVLTDQPGVEALGRAGIGHARAANLANFYGCERSFIEDNRPGLPRDIDILFVGNLDPAAQGERLPWLGRIARLAARHRVVIRTGARGGAYRDLLCRARIVFNRSVRGECNLRTFEAVACGALLFQEAGNREVPAYFRDRQECVYYRGDDLEDLLEHYLAHEDERRAIAEAGRARVREYRFDLLWERCLEQIEREWPALLARAARRREEARPLGLVARTWQLLASNPPRDAALADDLAAAVAADPTSSSLHNALGLAATRRHPRSAWQSPEVAREAAVSFQRAWECNPANALAGLNLAEAWAVSGQKEEAIAQARRVLAGLVGWEPGPGALEAGHFPPVYDFFRLQWERAAWANAGDPAAEAAAKVNLIHWRLHALLAQLTGDLYHAAWAVHHRPDLWPTQALLGRTLHRAGRPDDAIPHLRRALEANPWDRTTARALFEALGSARRHDEQGRLVQERRLLHRAAAEVIPAEAWFSSGTVPSGGAAPASGEALDIVWEGAQESLHSFALVNRELCQRLRQRGHRLTLVTHKGPGEPSGAAGVMVVRHQWPPDLTPPADGHWIMIQPWEFGSLPRAWIGPMSSQVDEVWVPSHHVKRCYLQSGVPEDRVQVVPNGIDPQRFHAGAPPLPLETSRRFKFLFVGGTIHRKGIDVLLEAYAQAFSERDDVCLVIKDVGASTFYRGQTAQQALWQYRARPGAPAIEYIDRDLSAAEMAGLYRACDCLVHPYRGEGFALPVPEAMACGVPVIVTGHGAALDYCDDTRAFLIPVQEKRFAHKRIGNLETVDYPWLAEPDVGRLAALLRHVVEDPAEARAKAEVGCAHVHAQLTWEKSAAAVEARLVELRRRPPRRLAGRKALVGQERPVRRDAAPTFVAASGSATGRAAGEAGQRVSLCMIVRNEGDKLARCLCSAADLVDEMVVVDTGSTDDTREVARGCGARVVDFAWVDDFSAARNESIRHAGGDWVFWLDADEWLDADNRGKLGALFSGLGSEKAGYVMQQLSEGGDGLGSTLGVDQVRLFRRDPVLRWEYRVHEQILLAHRRAGYDVRRTDIVIRHSGFRDEQASQRKLERNLRLLQREVAERPNDPITLYHLGQVYSQQKRAAEAVPVLRRSLELSPADYSNRPRLYVSLARCTHRLGDLAGALAVCREGRREHPGHVELLFLEGLLLVEQGDLTAAERVLGELLRTPPRPQFGGVDLGLRTYKARHLLGEVYRRQGRVGDAETQWRAAAAEKPGFGPAWKGLAEVYLGQGRWQKYDEACQRVEAWSPSQASMLRAQAPGRSRT